MEKENDNKLEHIENNNNFKESKKEEFKYFHFKNYRGRKKIIELIYFFIGL